LKTVLVTGGAGYIGSHTCKALSQAGFLPVTYDNLSTGHESAVKWGPFVHGDIADEHTLTETIKAFKPEAVLHFAADALVLESQQNPSKYYRNNVAGTLCLLETMRACAINQLIFSSTCSIYGAPKLSPITEDHALCPITPYGRSKWMAEQIMDDFDRAYGLKTVKLRYFNAAGADLDSDVGEQHNPETHLIPRAIQTALGLRKEIVVYGTDFETHDGSAVRDFTHVKDLADAHVLALEYLQNSGQSDVFNLGTGQGMSVFEIIDAIQKFSGMPFKVLLDKRHEGDPDILTADSQKAKRILQWVPKYSSLPTIIESAYKWHKSS